MENMEAMKKTALTGLLKPLERLPEFNTLIKSIKAEASQQMVFGLSGTQQALVMAGVIALKKGPMLVITPTETEANTLVDDLKALLPGRRVVTYPVWQPMPVEVLSRSVDVISQRLEVLELLAKDHNPVVVAPVESVMRRLVPLETYKKQRQLLKPGDQVDLQRLQRFLAAIGYERAEMVEGLGQFSVRGGILDIYPMTGREPVRIELWGDEIDSIRTFDAVSQRSVENLFEIEITPAKETVLTEKSWSEGRERIRSDYQSQQKRLFRSATVDAQHQLAAQVESWLSRMEQPVYFEGIEQLLPYLYPRVANILDYLPAGACVLVDDPIRTKEVAETIQKERAEIHGELLSKGKVLPAQHGVYLEWRQLLERMEKRNCLHFSFLPRSAHHLKISNIINFTAKAMHPFLGNTDVLSEEIKHWRRKNNSVVLQVSSDQRAKNLLETLKENRIDAVYLDPLTDQVVPGNVIITKGQLSAGFELPGARLVLITEKEIYGQRKRPKYRQQRTDNRFAPFEDLKVNDYVVHVNHGIGRYLGVTTLDIGGIQRDYLIVKFAGDDKVYVPTDQVGLLQRYLGNEGVTPKLSKLGGSEWNRAKGKVRQAVREMAEDLLRLYAKRQASKGYAFGEDTVWQKEFEMSFPYEETPDQLKAIQEVKKDMEAPRPMDRLLCGDVGYGKTEVALRAAFKAVNEDKQVAVLVPTTILAQQHYNTFRERFAPYPINIEVLSRFRTPKEQRQVLAGLKDGTVDIVIGTHRLVQADVKFKDLGLLVVDEEQRFGVAHKEKLKQLRETVDVLTLTATPIPRTLHMSLVKVRDTSLLETPPEERFPVQTYVLEEDPIMIREAIKREINRGGQVYFVHNRVAELDTVHKWLRELVPEARFVVAHGQMKEDQLERVMLDFMEGRYDVLICTTIIETGLDISNVNTLIVKDADKFGLAQLYQLRGRVGRTNRLAYAYLTFRREKVLTEVAEKRLSAIREFTDLGSGYKIAMRDLEIRGAGNILGVEQHGHIAEVGFDLYCRMLEEAVQEAKGEVIEKPLATAVELPVDAYIPEDYIKEAGQKVEIYRRLAEIKSLEELAELEDELMDRYGELPEPVQRLLMVCRLRVMAAKLRIKSITYQRAVYRFAFGPEPPLDAGKLVKLGELYRNRLKFNNLGDEFEIQLKSRDLKQVDVGSLKMLMDFIKQIA
ncbi:transcription-repair coupling factor [Desulfofalx alkaliphila]|uniref:transcription-repair coupling factor n=1 Tax=Desulfofalx alkaliphila TaxID=105483 RepID=UPI000AEF6B36|nr:transcription-repair coupling factor [Desulfofalx alkaliphila]